MAYKEYVKTNWVNGQSYGETAFNNIEDGIKSLEQLVIEGGVGSGGGGKSASYSQKNNLNLAKATKKLKLGKVPSMNNANRVEYVDSITEFAFMGDSVFWGFNTLETDTSKKEATCVDDMGNSLSGFSQSDIRIPNEFRNVMNGYYGAGKISIVDKTFTGIEVLRALPGYNATNSDFVFVNYGINDAVGGHVDQTYLSWIEKMVPLYRELIEKQIDGGSAVVVVGPVRQTLVGPIGSGDEHTTDYDSRTLIDLYEQAIRDIAAEYSCPYISGDDLTRDFDNTFSIDFTHFTDEAYTTIANRLASPFVGSTSPKYGNSISGNTYLGVNPQRDGIKLSNGAIVEFHEFSPNMPIALKTGDLYASLVDVNPGGAAAKVKGFGKISWSFYAEQDGMVIIPNLYSEIAGIGVDFKLDGGSKQGTWANYWNSVDSTSIDRTHTEPTKVSITEAQLEAHGNGKRYGLHMITSKNQPVIRVCSKGWHTVTLEVTPGLATKTIHDLITPTSIPTPNPNHEFYAFGINVLSSLEYKNLVG